MADLKELREKQEKLVVDARAKLDEIKDDTIEARAKEIESEYDKIMADYDKLDKRVKREEDLAARDAALKAAIEQPDERRPNGEDRKVEPGKTETAVVTDEERTKKHADAFRSYLRYGMNDMGPEQRAILREFRTFAGQGVGTGADGGYLVPQGFMAELVKTLKAWGPMLDAGFTRQMMTASGNSIPWPTMDDTSNKGALIAENTQVALSEITFGTKTIDAYKYTSGVVLVSSELLQDSALDVEAIVRAAMGERIARIGNEHLTTGDGASKPHGLIPAAGTTSAAAAAAITFDDMIELEHSVDPAYRGDPSCKFMFNDSTLRALRKLKDGFGNYIWQPANAATGEPSRILNYGYAINQDMASIATTAKTVAFGAFNRYLVRIVNEFSIRRLVERYADYDQTGFIGFTRLDGELLDANAVKVLTHP